MITMTIMKTMKDVLFFMILMPFMVVSSSHPST
jgi:hypothetical protein